jgi:CRP-like cAMP-binding protein
MADLLDLAADLPAREIPAGEFLLVEGTTSGALFVLVEGPSRSAAAMPSSPWSISPANLGEISTLLGRPHRATVVAVVPTRVRVAFDGAAFLNAPMSLGTSPRDWRLEALNAYLVDIREQYAGADGQLGLREPDPRY